MRPRPMPANAKRWEEWPTVDVLIKSYPDIKLTTLRTLLRKVPCYKADDNTVRYKQRDVDTALRAAEPLERDDLEDDDAPREPEDDDAAARDDAEYEAAIQAATAPVLRVMLREQRRGFEDSARACREALRTLGETIRLMADPLRMGIQLNNDAQQRNAAELKQHQRTYDRMVTTTEDLLSERVDRELKAEREKQTQQFRADAMDLAKTHGVDALRKWGLTVEGTAAVSFIRSVDPVVIMMARRQGFITDEQLAQLRKVRSDLADEPEPDPSEPSAPPAADTVQ